MNSRAALVAGLFVSVMATASCETPQAPVSPVGPSSLVGELLPRLSGNWGGELTLGAVAGGTGPAINAGGLECVGAAFGEVFGEKNDYTLSITQTSLDLTGTLVSSQNGLACTYTGRLGSKNSFVMHADECTPKTLTFLCPNGDGTRTLDLVGASMTATFDDPVNPTSITGTTAYTYNVTGVGALVVGQSFQGLTRR